MPLLPRKNNLDYQPDNIIQASKQLTTIALDNMKNPLTDPDQPALNALTSQKSVNGSMTEFSKMLIQLQSSFTKAKQEGVKVAKQMGIEIDLTLPSMRGEGRPIGSKNKPTTTPEGVVRSVIRVPRKKDKRRLLIVDDDTIERPLRNPDNLSLYERVMRGQSRGSAEPVGRYGVLPVADYSRRMISQGAVADAEIDDPDEEDTRSSVVPRSYSFGRERGAPDDDPYDDDDYSSRSSRDERRDPNYWDDADGDDTNSNHYPIGTLGRNPFDDLPIRLVTDVNPITSLSALLLDITKQIRYMDLMLISTIKPSVQQLNEQQLSILADAYKTLTKIGDDFRSIEIGHGITLSIIDVFNEIIPFGSGITKVLLDELRKLKMDLLIVVNSFKQNEMIAPPNFTPTSFWDNSSVREMEGAGRSFSGRNMSGRDIPTIWKGAMRESAYKYML
jgi:hypothetical protein